MAALDGIRTTDEQWARVRDAAFAGRPDCAGDRAVVNLLLLRDRARLPWSLLPVDADQVAEVRERAELWRADGTWARVRAALQPIPDHFPDERRPSSRRRRAAQALHAVPGGSRLLIPARRLIQLVQFARSRFTPSARLPGVFREARDLYDRGEYLEAANRFAQVLAVDAENGEARAFLGACLLGCNETQAARDHLLQALTAGHLPLQTRILANRWLVETYLRQRELDRAICHQYLAALLERFGDHAPWYRDELAEEAEELELLAEAHADIAERVLKELDGFHAERIYVEREAVLQRLCTLFATAAETLYLPDDWVRSIGHIALLDSCIKALRLGWLDRDRIVLHAAAGTEANRAYLDYFRPFLRIITDPKPGGVTRHLATIGPRMTSRIELPGHPERYFLEAIGAIQHEWERQGREPLLSLSAEDRAFGHANMRAMGVPDGAWFVGLHVRTPGFFNEKPGSGQDHRNADIESYRLLIAEVVRRGGWVIRLGDPSMPPLPPMPQTIDYARGPYKSDRMDVFLCAACRFFVGVTSGPSHVPTSFGVPCLITNWISHVLPVASRNDLFLPKAIWSEGDGRPLTWSEWLDRRHSFAISSALRRNGLEVRDNTPEELRDAAAEMLDRLDGSWQDEPGDERRQQRFVQIAERHGLVGIARVSRDFLRRHQSFLGDDSLDVVTPPAAVFPQPEAPERRIPA